MNETTTTNAVSNNLAYNPYAGTPCSRDGHNYTGPVKLNTWSDRPVIFCTKCADTRELTLEAE